MIKRALVAFTLLGWLAVAAAANPQVELRTSAGTMVVELYAERAPKTVANFLQYVKSGFYDGTIFHRVIDGFMIQGGGFDRTMREKATQAPIANEARNGLKNAAGTLAMARTADPNSATAQFFINLVDNPALDYPSPDGYGYAVFGRVTRGFEVAQKIARMRTGTVGMYENVPVEPVVIESARVVAAPTAKRAD